MGLQRAQLQEDRRLEQGVWLFLVSLAIFFIGCIILFAIYVKLRVAPDVGRIQPFYLPPSFILTTLNLLAVSVLLHMAVQAIRREMRQEFIRYVIIAFVLSITFFAVQGLGLTYVIMRMYQPDAANGNLYGLTFFLVIVHALHVIGGVAGITFLLFGIAKDRYDHERHFPVRFAAIYWHFLDVVWILMFASFAFAAHITDKA
ncbi:MAG: heme-copper oxidase subunit III [Planctomycetales bacterium]|nr:heme-copper oxidase subunit III [Planctomycetales bacterium]